MNDKKILLISKIAIYVLAGVTLTFLFIMFFNSNQFQSPTPEALKSSLLGNCFLMTYITFGIAILSALLFPVIRMVAKPKQLLKGLVGIVGIFALGFIAYLFASNDLTPQQLEKLQATASDSILVGAGMNLTYIMGVFAILAVGFLIFRGNSSK